MADRPRFYSHHSSLEHETGGHPENAGRIRTLNAALEQVGYLGWERVDSPPVSREVLVRVHAAPYIDTLEAVSARGGGALDADTIMSSGSFDAALHGVGGAVAMVESLIAGSGARIGFSAHRPPGHHATADRAMGFCLFNGIAVAARHAIDTLGLERVMILDWDVHHGNGTQDIFWESPEVLFVSIHQSPLYPGTGAESDLGAGAGLGTTVNLPVPAGSGDAEFVSLVREVAVPRALDFKPQLLLVSAGYDAHVNDPLAGCTVTDAGYAALATEARRLADAVDAPLGLVLEGGYDPPTLARCVVATMEHLDGTTA